MSEITDLMNGPNYEPVRNDSWRAGRRNGVKWAVEYLHGQAKSMNDPHATQVLNAAAFHLGTDAKLSITDASLADTQRASFVRGEMGNIEADRAETRLTRPCTPASHVDANDDLFDDQIADAIWEASSNGDGRITAVSLRRELALLGLQIVSKAYHDSIAIERDELRSALAIAKEALECSRECVCAEIDAAREIGRVAFQYKLKTRLDLVYSAITAIGAAEKGKLDYANLLACYRSGQVSEAQWQQHLSDPEFAKWLKDAEAKTQK